MAGSEELPAWYGTFRNDLRDLRTDMGAQIDKMVSKEAFEAEIRHRNERHTALEAEVRAERDARVAALKLQKEELAADLQTEREARAAAITAETVARQALAGSLQSQDAAKKSRRRFITTTVTGIGGTFLLVAASVWVAIWTANH